MATDPYPIYASAVALPILGFPSWILCIPPMVWHLSQRNLAAGSLVLWMVLLNFFNSINPLIWPRDNVDEWWNGAGLCDIQARIQVGAVVALPACTAVIARRLANVMDTRNITVAPSKRSVLIERVLEIAFCWVYPAILMITYYIVQPFRYYIYGISGCVAVYDSSWPSLALIWIWGCITTLVAAFYSGLLGFRLIRYRREFHRLIAARNTTKSRFVRLFLMSFFVTVLLLPYSFFILYSLASTVVDTYSWSRVHGPDWNSVAKIPAYGTVRWDRWGLVATGYVTFILFGTGADANNTYKRMLTSVGFGKVFPSLYNVSESGASTPSGVTFGKRWTSNLSSKAKSLFSKNGSISEASHNESFAASTLRPMDTNEEMAMLPQDGTDRTSKFSRFTRLFIRAAPGQTILPMFNRSSAEKLRSIDKSRAESIPDGFSARAWAADSETADQGTGVHVLREFHQASQDKGMEKMIG